MEEVLVAFLGQRDEILTVCTWWSSGSIIDGERR